MLKSIIRMSSSKFINRLATEKSPYLLQHKNNPIEWFPWGSEAFDLAKSRNCPIFLSVGYSTCHWCHVMEKESFENIETAKILNDNFVSIKVDREERPDVDKLYMAFIVAVSGHGGWPMSVFLTPELAPITGGTYFPPDDSRGMLGFPTILNMISKEWKNDRGSIIEQGNTILGLLQRQKSSGDVINAKEIYASIYTHKQKTFDSELGGFGSAPKFPKASDLDFLISCASVNKTISPEIWRECEKMLETTLECMAKGGIHDHVGKGFHRYSVDGEWHVPHFEKMLYDQAQLIATYSDFYKLNERKNEEIKKVIGDIFEHMDEQLSHEEGGFYAAEDADSLPTKDSTKKMEGAFCVWEKKEIETLLGALKIGNASLSDVFCEYYDVENDGNVPRHSDPHGELSNKNVLRRLLTNEECAKNFGISTEELLKGMEEAKNILWELRKDRPKPHLDSKMVTAWQGLAITGLVKAYQALGDSKYLSRAEKCKTFVTKYLKNEENELIRAVYLSEDGSERIEQRSQTLKAFSDDYAFLIQGLLDLYSVNGDSEVLKLAVKLQEIMDAKFWNGNGYYISEENAESGVTVRMVEDQDGAEPCSTSVAARNLLRFYAILELDEFKNKATDCFKGSSEILNKAPIALPKMAIALDLLHRGSTTVVLVGDPQSELLNEAKKLLNQKFISNLSVVHIVPDQEDDIAASGGSHKEMAKSASPAVYICEGFVCDRPLRTLSQLDEKFKSL